MTQFPDLTPEQARRVMEANPKLVAATQKAAAAFGVSFRGMADRMAAAHAAYEKRRGKQAERLLEQVRRLNV